MMVVHTYFYQIYFNLRIHEVTFLPRILCQHTSWHKTLFLESFGLPGSFFNRTDPEFCQHLGVNPHYLILHDLLQNILMIWFFMTYYQYFILHDLPCTILMTSFFMAYYILFSWFDSSWLTMYYSHDLIHHDLLRTILMIWFIMN